MFIQQALRRIFPLTTAAVCLSVGVLKANQNPGATFLLIWPTARSTALAGAMTGLADDPDAAYWNPGGLAFQKGLGGCATFCNWLPGLYQGMYYTYASAGVGGIRLLPGGTDLNIGTDITYFTTGETDVVNERGDYLGRFTTYSMTVGLHAGANLTNSLGVGANLKYIRRYLVPEWVWWELPACGIEGGGTANDVMIDVGALYKPLRALSLGLTLANLGPKMKYTETGESDPLPLTLRIGGCLTPLDAPLLRVRALLEVDKILVGVFSDTTGTKTFARMWTEETRDAWKSLAVEATVLQLFSARVGYFEDLTWQRGGIVLEKDGQTYHYGLGDILARKNLGRFSQIGICWGIAVSYKDHARLEISDDSKIWDFPTSNAKIALTVNDVGGMIVDLTSGRPLDWMP